MYFPKPELAFKHPLAVGRGGRRGRNICVCTLETELRLSTPTGLLPKHPALLRFICNASIVYAALFWHCSHCLCRDATSPASPSEMLHSSVTLVLLCQPADAFLHRNGWVLEKKQLEESSPTGGYLKIAVAVRRLCLSVEVFSRYSTERENEMERSLNSNGTFYVVCRDKCKSVGNASVHPDLLPFECFVLICFA